MRASALALAEPAVDVALEPAALEHVEGMARLIDGFARRGLMLPKSEADLCRHVREFLVVTDRDGSVVACGGLRIYRPGLAEIVGLAVDEAYHGRGLGGAVVDALLDEADRFGIGTVFAMTLQEAFFHRRGFRTVPRSRIPEKVAADCTGCFRREGCEEIAVLRTLGPRESGDGGGGPRPLPVVPGG